MYAKCRGVVSAARRLGLVDVGRQLALARPHRDAAPRPSRRSRRRLAVQRHGHGAHARLPRARRGRAIHRVDDLRHFARAEHDVDFGDQLAQLVAIALGQAAGDDEAAAGAGLLVLGELQDRVDRFLLRLVDEGAGVDDQHVGFVRPRRQLVAGFLGEAQHHLGVDEVFRAAERDETNFHDLLLTSDSTTDTADTACADTESSRGRAPARRSRLRRARCPCRSRCAAPSRSGAGRDTSRTLPAAGCDP